MFFGKKRRVTLITRHDKVGIAVKAATYVQKGVEVDWSHAVGRATLETLEAVPSLATAKQTQWFGDCVAAAKSLYYSGDISVANAETKFS